MFVIYETKTEAINRRDSINQECIGTRWDQNTLNYSDIIELVGGKYALPYLGGYESFFTLQEKNKLTKLIFTTSDVVSITIPTQEEIEIEDYKKRKLIKIEFGKKLVDKYKAKNDLLGFESLTRSQRKSINTKLRKVFRELEEGYLKDAIEEIKETVNEDFDGVYVRKSRYLKLRNDIHIFLGEPEVSNYND